MRAKCCMILLGMIAAFYHMACHDALAGGKITSFTADQVHIDPKGKIISTSKLYVTPDRIAIDDLQMGPAEQTLSIIYFINDKRQYTLNSKKKLYFEGPIDEKGLVQDLTAAKTNETEKTIGMESIGEFKCSKKERIVTVEFMGMKRDVKQIIWVSEDVDMPVRTQMEDGSYTEIKNFQKGAPAAKYFQVPKDYKKVTSLMAVMDMEFSADEGDDGDIEREDANPNDRVIELPKGMNGIKIPGVR